MNGLYQNGREGLQDRFLVTCRKRVVILWEDEATLFP
jgi:hypothetical protein